MSKIEQFDKWVQNARRDDDYINATKWCKHFEYDLRNWKRLPETKARLTALSEELEISHSLSKELIYTSGRGNKAVTWIHPVMAVHLASYLDPDFANYVAQVFIRYAKADPTLAADIASRQNTVEGLDIINEAVQKRYSIIAGRDWFFETDKIKFLDEKTGERDRYSESRLMSYLNNKLGLPYKRFIVAFPWSVNGFGLVEDFLKEKYPNIYQSAFTFFELPSGLHSNISVEDETALFSYFLREINDWVKEKGGSDCSFLR
ncbi:KilA-N domain-containing protein [Nostoc sp. LPT]|uniref:KilA-N domain-containing protein n=1 Tax=Nostoc sp. LPT TaxID=2815387 RepID=UPI001DBE48F1|nr:KilA-N domain-containing protein [Nostoc sp. LPT]MBN4002211.1 KilA-N domain-containing protein [Nostoc sp. LPT]